MKMESEVALISKVELRIALAGTDDKFEALLQTYLAPLLLKLLSPYSQVRTQILKLIQHLITRINAARTIKLPVKKLLEQVELPKIPLGSDPASVRLYTLVFVSKGIDRLSPGEKLELVPDVIKGISKFSLNVSARLFYNFLKLISDLKDSDELSLEGIDEQDQIFITESISKFLLFVPYLGENGDNKIPDNYTCPGLTYQDCQFLTTFAGITYNSQQMSKFKPSLLTFLGKIQIKERIVPLIVASCDSSLAIADSASSIYRRYTIEYEDPKIIETFIQMVVGDLKSHRTSVKVVLQERILTQILSHSVEATKSNQVSKISSNGLGSNYLKLRAATIQFIQWVTKNLAMEDDGMDTDINEDFNINIAAQLMDNLNSESWDSNSGISYQLYVTQRSNQYDALAVILKKNPKLLSGLAYINFLFENLKNDLPELRSTISDALNGLTVHLPNFSQDDKSDLKRYFSKLLSDDQIIKTENDKNKVEGIFASRYILIKYINCCFPFDDAESRLLCALGTSQNNRSNIIEEASRGLHPHWFKITQSSNTAEFKSTTELLGKGVEVNFPTFQSVITQLYALTKLSEDKQFATLKTCMSTAIKFAIQCLVMQSIQNHQTVIVSDQEWAVRLEKALEYDEQVLKLIADELNKILHTEEKYVKDFENSIEWNSLDLLLSILAREFLGKNLQGLKIAINDDEPKIIFGKMFVKILSLSSQDSISQLASATPDFYQLLLESTKSISDDLINYIAQSIGIIATHPQVTDEDLVTFVSKMIANLSSKYTDGLVLALGYVLSRAVYRGRESVISPENYKIVLDQVLDGLKASESRLVRCSMEAISQLSIFGAMGPQLKLIDDMSHYQSQFIDELAPKVKRGNERAALTWAHLSLSFDQNDTMNLDDLTEFEQAIYDTHISKQIEYLFTSGEAFTIIAAGWNSKVLTRMIDINDNVRNTPSSDIQRVPIVLDKILKACANTKPSLRRLGCIWLLSFVQYLSHMESVKDRAPEIHIAFMRFLSDRDEMIQESASRGLTMVYEMGDSELKDTLVRGLLKSFTDSNTSKTIAGGSISEETELFEPGVLRTDDGSVSTYKDILNLASEVGDPSLVYKFMSLARNSALWSSRKGIAFGLGSILSKSSLDELLASDEKLSNKLIPKLFRYRFDPSPSVSRSMNDIWNTLISDSSKTVSAYVDAIFDELLKGIGNKEWRVRQASTAALSDLIQSLSFEKYEERLEDIWNMGLRSVDDIKDSVRKEGNKLSRILASILVRSIDVQSSTSLLKANSVLSKLIPTLLGTRGLLSDVEDIRNFALETILNLCKKSGLAIKPFIPTLIGQLISLMSTLEPQVINYLTLNADKYNMTASDIDAKRLQSVGHSPMMDAIERLLDLVDEDIMKEVIPELRSSIRTSVGLPSKAAGSRVLVTLVVRHLHSIQPYGDQLLKTCQQQIKDKNETISSSYATSAGYLCRVASIDSVVSFCHYLQKLYFESESEQSRKAAGIACEAVSKYSGDTFASVASAFLPFAYIAKHDPEASVKSFFETAWSDNTAGNGAIKLYIQEISTLVNQYMDSQQYLIRQVCAKSIADACDKIDSGSNGIGSSSGQLFEVLINACKGRSWSGKEDVFESLVSLSIKSKYFLLNEDTDLMAKINKVVLTEARRNNRDYKQHAVKSMGRYVKEFDELVDEYVEIMQDYLLDEDSVDDEDEESEVKKLKLESSKSSRKNLKKEEDRLKILGDIVSTFTIDEQDKSYHQKLETLILDSIVNLFETTKFSTTWRSQIAICRFLSAVCGEFKKSDCKMGSESTEKLALIESKLFQILDYTIENVVIQYIRSCDNIIAATENSELKATILKHLDAIEQRAISSIVKVELDSVVKNVK